MAKLTASKRASLPKKDFAGPGRSFPVNDKNHARAALMLENKAPASARPGIEAKAKAMLKSPARTASPGGGGSSGRGMTAKQDAKYDASHGIKAGSAADKKMDRKLMSKPGGGGTSPIGKTGGPTPVRGAAVAHKSPSATKKTPTSGSRVPMPRRGGSARYGVS